MKRVVLTVVGVIGLLTVTLLLRTFTFSSQQVQVTTAAIVPVDVSAVAARLAGHSV